MRKEYGSSSEWTFSAQADMTVPQHPGAGSVSFRESLLQETLQGAGWENEEAAVTGLLGKLGFKRLQLPSPSICSLPSINPTASRFCSLL